MSETAFLEARPARLQSALPDSNRPWVRPRSAYVHVPFCQHHCGYCDFAVVAGRDDRIDDYLTAFEREMARLPVPCTVDTIFIGGGTPTYLSAPQLQRLLVTIEHWLPLAERGEYSVESTPESLDVERVRILADAGVNRVSIGAQSFRAEGLRALDRVHSPADVTAAVEAIRRYINNVSLDLIFGVPGQTPGDWDGDLAAALALRPDHISCYGLTYEKGTPFWKQRQAGLLPTVEEEAERWMFLRAEDVLTGAGYEHYEISNYARPGRRCRHNEVYWANHAYYGFGLGAARYLDGRREVNTRSLDEYLKRNAAGESVTQQSEKLVPFERAKETLTVQMRREQGVDRGAYAAQTGYQLDDVAGEALGRLAGLGLLSDNGTRVALTRSGRCVADAVLVELWSGR